MKSIKIILFGVALLLVSIFSINALNMVFSWIGLITMPVGLIVCIVGLFVKDKNDGTDN